jgi:hypothetical protein
MSFLMWASPFFLKEKKNYKKQRNKIINYMRRKNKRFLSNEDLVVLGLGGLGPLEGSLHGAADELVGSVDNTLGQGSELLEGGGGQVDLVGGASGAVVNDADNDGATTRGDLGALEASSLLTSLVEVHVNGTNVPAVTSVDVGVVHQVTVASDGLEIVSVEPGRQTGHLLAETDNVGGTVVSLVVRGSDDGDEGEAHGHDESGKLSEVHDGDMCLRVEGCW